MQSTPEYWAHVQQLCKLVEPRMNKSFGEAIKRFNEHNGNWMYLFLKRDMPSNMHIHIRDRIRTNFAGLPWAYIIEESRSAFLLLIVGQSLGIPVILGIKFKKQSKGLKTANIQTQAVIDFNTQQAAFLKYLPIIQAALPIDGMKDKVMNPPKGCNIIAGYTPDIAWGEYLQLTLTFPLGGGKVKLLSDFTRLEAEHVADVVEIPRKEEPKKRTVRVRHRRNVSQPTRKKLRKFIASDASEQETNDQHLKKKKGNDGQGS